jgi:AcrR family transcriptional regulator
VRIDSGGAGQKGRRVSARAKRVSAAADEGQDRQAAPASEAGARQKSTYHHGDLAPALREAALTILEKKGLAALSLRSVAKRAGVSHAAPYRHYKNLEALLADVATIGFEELRAQLRHAAASPGQMGDRIARIGAAYVRFATQHGGLLRLMLGHKFSKRSEFAALQGAADSIGEEIGAALGDPALGLAVWGAAHGLATLTLEDVIDLGQRTAGVHVLPSRAEILIRSLFSDRD